MKYLPRAAPYSQLTLADEDTLSPTHLSELVHRKCRNHGVGDGQIMKRRSMCQTGYPDARLSFTEALA